MNTYMDSELVCAVAQRTFPLSIGFDLKDLFAKDAASGLYSADITTFFQTNITFV